MAVAGVSGVLVSACGSDDETARPAHDEAKYELQPWVTELGPDVLETLTESDPGQGTLRFKGRPAAVATRKQGDVLIGGKSSTTPKGLLRGVVSVTEDAGDTVVETLPVPLPLAFKSLHAKLSRSGIDLVSPPAAGTGPTSLAPAASPQLHSVGKTVNGKRVYDAEVYNLDKNPDTKDDQFLVHAELQGTVGFKASVDLDWLDSQGALSHAKGCLDEFLKDPTSILSECVSLPDVKVSFEATLSGNGLLDVDGAAAKEYKSGSIPLNEQPWELPDLWAGPVLLTPELDFTASVEGDAATYFHARTEFGYELGVEAAVGTVSGVSPPAPTFVKHVAQPIVEVSSTGRSKASFGPRLSLFAYDTFGFSVDLHGFGELEADQGKTPCWDYTLGMQLTPGIRLRIPWKRFGLQKLAKEMGWTGDLASGAIHPITLYEAHPFDQAPAAARACKQPPISALPLGEGPTSETYQTPTFTPWSYRFGNVEATQPFVADPGQSRALVDKTHASSWLVSGANLGSVMHLGDDGSVVWARAIEVGLLPDEAALALDAQAQSALGSTSDALDIFVASDRLTLLALEYDGSVKWARRLRLASGLPGPELRELSPVAMTRIEGGDFGVLYSRQVPDHAGSELVLLRVSAKGSLRFAKRFAFPTGESSHGSALIPIGQDLIVTGHSFEPTEEAAYFLRFTGAGALTYAKRLTACGSTRVRIESGTLRASGDLAFVGTRDVGSERAFFATVSANGEPHGVQAIWTGSTLQDVSGVAVAELPTSGFVSLARYTPYVTWSSALELSTHDSQGIRTNGKGYNLKDLAGTALAKVEPRALRLTTDGGALLVAHVTDDGPPNEYGLWISKISARTFDAPFDPSFVSPSPSSFTEEACTLDISDASVTVQDITLEDVDVTALVQSVPITPTIHKRMQ